MVLQHPEGSAIPGAAPVVERAPYRKLVRWILPLPFVCSVSITASAFAPTPALTIAALCVAFAGINACVATFRAVPSGFLTARAAGRIAMIVAVGNLGAFAGPYRTSLIRDLSGGFTPPLAIGCTLLFGATRVVVFGRPVRQDAVPAAIPA